MLPSPQSGSSGPLHSKSPSPTLKTGNGESRSWVQIPTHPFFGMGSFQQQSDYDPAAPARRNASARHTGKPISGGQTTQPLRSILSAV